VARRGQAKQNASASRPRGISAGALAYVRKNKGVIQIGMVLTRPGGKVALGGEVSAVVEGQSPTAVRLGWGCLGSRWLKGLGLGVDGSTCTRVSACWGARRRRRQGWAARFDKGKWNRDLR
jgi:hypothetical protein